jgi:hypothetical protein
MKHQKENTTNKQINLPSISKQLFKPMKITQLAALVCFVTTSALAQERPDVKYGKVNADDFKTTFTTDSSAEAVVIYENGDVEFGVDDFSITIIKRYHVRMKILKKSGTDRGIIKIPLTKFGNGFSELLRSFDGCTYNLENGKVVASKLKNESVFHEHVSGDFYQDKMSFPNLKEGSILEYRYVLETPYAVSHNPDAWYFQKDIPVVWSEYHVLVPVYLTYRNITGGYLKFAINKKENSRTNLSSGLDLQAVSYQYAVKDIPSFHEEKFITSRKDYLSKVNFELITVAIPGRTISNFADTWDNVTKNALKEYNFGEYLDQKKFLKSAAQEISMTKDTMKKINAAFEYICKNIKWNNITSLVPLKDLAAVFENKTGNSAEINVMLINLLRSLGFDANVVILSTRGNGEINELYPMVGQFNYSIACVTLNGKDILMDATDPFTRPGMLPERCLTGIGRLMKEKGARFVSLRPAEKSARFEMLTASLNPSSGEISGSSVISKAGYDGHEVRVDILEKGEEEIVKTFKKSNSEWEIKNFKLENKDNISEPIKFSFDFNYPENVSATTIYINPMLSGKVSNNPFTEQNRIYPVDLIFTSDNMYMATIKIPEGYTVEELPKPASVALPDNLGKFSYMINVVGADIKISSRITLNEYYFAPQEYELLKNFYDLIVQKHAEQLVLKKK